MRTTREVQRLVVETTDITCNQCGGSCRLNPDVDDRYLDFEGLIETDILGGYGSRRLGDGNRFVFSLCEDCLVQLFKGFKHPALVSSMWVHEPEDLEAEWKAIVGINKEIE